MQLRRVLPFVFILLTATACFRPADDSFDTVDSEGAPVIPSETPLAAVTVIEPGSTAATSEADAVDAVEEDDMGDMSETTVPATPTTEPTELRIIESTNTPVPPPPTSEDSDSTVPTATQPTIITPQSAPNQLPIATATVGAEETEIVSDPDLQATPTDPAEASSECEYIVRAGDNAFRIALNNNVALEDLLAANGLPEEPILQVGQVLLIPGCEEDASAETAPTSASATSDEDETTTSTTSDQTIHVVTSGETLLSIARRYGVTVNEIVNANNLTNPNVLDVGQELIIPQAAEEADDE